MNEQEYKKIKAFVASRLVKSLHSQYLEDATQYVAMRYFENGMKGNYEWYFLDFLRSQGFGKRGLVAAKPLTQALFFGHENQSDIDGDSGWILDQRPRPEPEEENRADEFKEYVERYHEIRFCLTKKERLVMDAYLEGPTMLDIGKTIGITESRVSQILKSAINRISEQEFVRLLLGRLPNQTRPEIQRLYWSR